MYKYIWYSGNFWVLPTWQYEEFMSIPRNSTAPTQDPYKFSVAMLSRFRGRIYVTLTQRHEGDFEVGFMRDWIAFVEAITEGIHLYKEEIEKRRPEKIKKKRRLKIF